MATFVEMPSRGFRVDLARMDFFLTRSSVKRGCQKAAALVECLLTLSAKIRVPSYEIIVFGGFTMSGKFQIASGLEMVCYE